MTDPLARLLPQDRESERAVLGSIMLEPNTLDDVQRLLGPDGRMFHHEHHRTLYETLIRMRDASETISDGLCIKHRMETEGTWERVGKFDFLGGLLNAAPSGRRAAHYAAIVRTCYIRRELIRAACRIMDDEYDGQGTLDDRIARAMVAIQGISEYRVTGEAECMERILADVYTEFSQPARAINTGLVELDALLGGLQPEQLYIVGGRPSAGKTAFAMTIAENLARNGKRILFFSIEMSRRQLVQRMLCSRSNVPMRALQKRDWSDAQWANMEAARSTLERYPILIDDSDPIRIGELCARSRVVNRRTPLDCIMADYIQIIDPDRRMERRDMEVGEIGKQFKKLAKELLLPVVVLSQLKREAEERKPIKSDLSESTKLEAHAHAIALLWKNPTDEGDGVRDIIIGKNRNGPLGTVTVRWNGQLMRFDDYLPGYTPTESQPVAESPARAWWP